MARKGKISMSRRALRRQRLVVPITPICASSFSRPICPTLRSPPERDVANINFGQYQHSYAPTSSFKSLVDAHPKSFLNTYIDIFKGNTIIIKSDFSECFDHKLPDRLNCTLCGPSPRSLIFSDGCPSQCKYESITYFLYLDVQDCPILSWESSDVNYTEMPSLLEYFSDFSFREQQVSFI
jgi:hypothetical protein